MSDEAYAAALSGLPGMGPATLAAILDGCPPSLAWRRVLDGEIERPAPRSAALRQGSPHRPPAAWSEVAARVDPPAWWAPLERRGISVTWRGHDDLPTALVEDPEPPGVLFWRGDLAALQRPCVAIVGTRDATPDGRRIAFELGRDLTAAGVCVVSGMALGIDGSAHAGAMQAVSGGGAPAAPVGVAASGVDVPYPRRHHRLWEQVAAAGAILSENLPGRPAQAWRFPSRNRIIAGLARLVVVVESHAAGGSLITAEAAIRRGIEVRAVPGPVHSAASAGSNQLLYDGPGPVRDAQDVLDALGLIRVAPASKPADSRAPRLGAAQRLVLAELGWTAVTPGRVMSRTGLSPAAAERVLAELLDLGLARCRSGWWYRCG